MKAVRYTHHGEPWDVAEVIGLPDPVLEPGQVLVSLEAAPIHIADLLAMRGTLPFFPVSPGVGGFEGVGRVIDCAADVAQWKTGDRVFLPIGYGAWQERHALAADRLMTAPEGVAAEQLALVPINLATAYLNLFAYEQLQPGEWAIQNAANSNVGSYQAKIAADKGVHLIHVVRRPELVEALKAQGREHVLLDGPDLAEQVAAITTQKPRLAIDAIGGEATTRMGACVADGGLVLSYGFLSKQPHAIAYEDLVFRGVRLRGMLTNFALERFSDDQQAQMRAYLASLMTADQLNAEIAGVFPFSTVKDALRLAAKTGADRRGKVILVPG
jgi:NADPH:quinone reductase-like Zn-dependent oxidoreductase